MLFDLQCHELEVVKAFFAKGIALTEAESASESAALAKLEQPDSETVENVIFNPNGAHEFEQILLRSVINELNCLCEFALQNTLIHLSDHQLTLEDNSLVFAANRGDVKKALENKNVKFEECSIWQEIEQIKELSEGFKHRQRLQPFPAEFHLARNQWRRKRQVDPDNENWLSEYELTATDVAGYLDAVEKFFSWLGPKCSQ